ncbi:class I SAM-dependent methyltransferase [Allosphingosinicella vermicomposti]|uniref:class I SAM-dependent methyltransferase n=1 Tax=Allosphingosinicella vermicomposti TaxID=614671 RepID=UPI000D108330|nr:class I SAM-dependent methyltransferase [Allosphingosinicella vermicomposti]
MTSRETTGLLPRIGDTPVVGSDGRSIGDWAALLSFGAIQWPWLLRSLSGGSKAAKAKLLDRLDLPQDSLPNLGSWKADTGLLTLLVDHILETKPRLVVEFGAGASTFILARALQKAGGGRLISFDQHADFVHATQAWLAEHGMEADMRAVPLHPSPDGWPGLWYDHGPLPDGIDMVVVDGPPWTIHPLTRGAASSLFDKISPGGTLFLDDAARPGERVVASRWKKLRPDFSFRLWKGGTKGTLIARKAG